MLTTLVTLMLTAPGPTPCATVHLMKDVDRSLVPVAHHTLMRARGPKSGKALRDSFDINANQETSENFVLRWGTDLQVAERDAEAILEAFEYAWEHQVGDMEFPAPYGTDDFKFNVYLGASGSGTPATHGAAGYYTRDMRGWPYIVLSPDTLWELDYTRTTIAHEFFHAIQDAAETYGYEPEEGAWYYEATAEWMTGETYPDSQLLGGFLFGYALLSNLPVDFFDYPDEGTLQEYHQYGAFIFPRFLSDKVANWTLIRDSWLHTNGSKDPLHVLDQLLQQNWNTNLADAFGTFAAHNSVWDYRRHTLYANHIETYRDWFDTGLEVVADVKPEGNETLVRAPEQTLPQRYGYNLIRLPESRSGDADIIFQGDTHGSQGSLANYRVTAVVQSAGSVSYFPITLDASNKGNTNAFSIEPGDTLYLVVAAPTQAGLGGPFSGETFGYQYQFTITDGSSTPAGTTQGTGGTQIAGSSGLDANQQNTKAETGGCSASGSSPSVLIWLLLLAGLYRRQTRVPALVRI